MTAHGYIRVSTLDQDTEKNKLDILKFANYIANKIKAGISSGKIITAK